MYQIGHDHGKLTKRKTSGRLQPTYYIIYHLSLINQLLSWATADTTENTSEHTIVFGHVPSQTTLFDDKNNFQLVLCSRENNLNVN